MNWIKLGWVALCRISPLSLSFSTSKTDSSEFHFRTSNSFIHPISLYVNLEHRRAPAVAANLHQGRLLVRKGHLPLLVEADVLEVSDEPGKQAIDLMVS